MRSVFRQHHIQVSGKGSALSDVVLVLVLVLVASLLAILLILAASRGLRTQPQNLGAPATLLVQKIWPSLPCAV